MSEIDVELENAIEEAGAERVFAMARSAGWSLAMPPPKWVWWEIIRELPAERDKGND